VADQPAPAAAGRRVQATAAAGADVVDDDPSLSQLADWLARLAVRPAGGDGLGELQAGGVRRGRPRPTTT